jgi:hypothetical protein
MGVADARQLCCPLSALGGLATWGAPQSLRIPKRQPRLRLATTSRQPGLHQVAMSIDASETYISIPLGIIVGLLASFVQSLGLTIQRKSHVLNQALPESEQRVEHRRP